MVFETLSLLLLLLVTPAEVTVVNVPARGNVSLMLAPGGEAEVERSGSVTRVKVEIDGVLPTSQFGPSMNTYVVWAVSHEGIFENLGELPVLANKARLEATTRFDQFAVLVTAEPHYMVDRPSSAIVYKNLGPRSANVRREVVSVQLGTYDYSKLPPSTATGVLSIAAQARSAYQIAGAAEAARWAESDFRQARISLDTMEEMLNRATPADILIPSANEAIRRSQFAFITARENAAAAVLQSARNDVAEQGRDIQQLRSRIGEITAAQAAAAERIRALETDLNAAGRQSQQISAEKEAVESRLRGVERELAELRRAQEDLQNKIAVSLPAEFFDYGQDKLTPAGQAALLKITGGAAFWSTPIRMGCPAAGVEILRRFLALVGTPSDRIVVVPLP